MVKKIVTDDGEIIDAPQASIYSGPLFFKTPWNHDTDAESVRTSLECKDPSRTQQQFAKDADINVILAKFMNTGQLSTTNEAPVYQDVEEEFDLQSKMVTAWEVQEAWSSLSPEVRNVLKDPMTYARYVEHCLETGDLEPLEKLGLAKAKAPEPASPSGGAPAPAPDKAAPAA